MAEPGSRSGLPLLLHRQARCRGAGVPAPRSGLAVRHGTAVTTEVRLRLVSALPAGRGMGWKKVVIPEERGDEKSAFQPAVAKSRFLAALEMTIGVGWWGISQTGPPSTGYFGWL